MRRIFCLMVCLLAVHGCGKSTAQKLEGKWTTAQPGVEITFKNDGTLNVGASIPGTAAPPMQMAGTWKADKDNLDITMENQTQHMKVTWTNANQFETQESTGKKETFVRAK